MLDIDLEPLRRGIREYKMMEMWGDSFIELSLDEKRTRARSRALRAKAEYLRIMRSSSNKGTLEFQAWAVKKALGIRTSSQHTAQPTGGKNWQAWG